MNLYELIVSRRSIRQFKSGSISRDVLRKLVNAARLAPSAANLQPLEFVVVDEEELRRKVFPHLRWAAYITPDGNPKPRCEPVAYMVVLVNLSIRSKEYERDVGAAIENVILTAWEGGIGTCWLVSIDRPKIKGVLNIPGAYRIDSVLALGYPAEKPLVEDMKESIKYWKDKQGQLHVPKRKMEDVIHFNSF